MTNDLIESALGVHCAIMVVLHAVLGFLLYGRGKFNWLSSGFWIWAASVLIFVVHPGISLLSGNIDMYVERLATTEGAGRVYWIMCVLFAGLTALFATYLYCADARQLKIPDLALRAPTLAVFSAFLALAFYCTLKYRVGAGFVEQGAVGLDGKFSGDTTGWETSMHRFALFPMAYLWLNKRTRWVGIAILLIYAGCRLFDAYERLTLFTPFIALAIVMLRDRKRSWPPIWMMAATAVLVLGLVLRGHQGIEELDAGAALREAPSRAVELLAGADTDMLPQFYKQSSLHDDRGYTYGLTFVESALFGYLPRRFFPWKDQLFNNIIFNPYNDLRWCRFIAGPKSSIIGYVYYYGSIVAVLLLCPLMGYLARKADGLIASYQPKAVQAIGVNYMSMMFMFFMSAPEWTLQFLVVMAVPLVVALGVARASGTEKRLRTSRDVPSPGKRIGVPRAASAIMPPACDGTKVFNRFGVVDVPVQGVLKAGGK